MLSLSSKAGLLIGLNLFKYFIGFLVPIAIARIITKAEYGTYQQLLLIGTASVGVARLGIPQSILYFYNSIKTEDKNTLVVQTAGLMLLSGIIFSIAIYFARSLLSEWLDNAELTAYIPIYCFYICFFVAVEYSVDLLVAKNRYRQAVVYQSVECILRAVFLIVPLIVYPDLTVLVVCVVFFSCVRFVFYFSLNVPEFLSIAKKARIEFFGLRQIRYGAPLAAASLVGLIGNILDKVLIAVNYSTEQFATYAVGSIEIPLDVIFQSSVMKVLSASLPPLAAEKKYVEIATILHESVRRLSLIVVPIFAFLFFQSSNVIVLLFTDIYESSASIFRIYLLLVPLHMFLLSIVPRIVGKTSINLKVTMFYVLSNIVLSLLSLHYLGFYGPAAATVAVSWIMSFVYLIVALKILKVKLVQLIPVKHILKVVIICVICAYYSSVIASFTDSVFLNFALAGMLYSILIIAAAFILNIINIQDRKRIKYILSKYINQR